MIGSCLVLILPALREEDLKLLLAANSHIGAKNCDANMERYVWRRRKDGTPRCVAMTMNECSCAGDDCVVLFVCILAWTLSPFQV